MLLAASDRGDYSLGTFREVRVALGRGEGESALPCQKKAIGWKHAWPFFRSCHGPRPRARRRTERFSLGEGQDEDPDQGQPDSQNFHTFPQDAPWHEPSGKSHSFTFFR